MRKLTGKKGVTTSPSEHVGPDTFNGSLLCLKRGGQLVTCGSTSGQSITMNLFQLYLQQYRITGSFGCSLRNIRDSLAKMASGALPVIDTEGSACRFRTWPRPSRKPAGVWQDHRQFLGRARLKPLLDPALGALAVALLRAVHWMDRRRSANFAGAFMRKVGPLLKEHRLGRENLRAAYPEKSDTEIEKILGGVWDNLGRLAVEFAHLDDFSVAGFGPRRATSSPYPKKKKKAPGNGRALRAHHEWRTGDDRL